VIALSAIPFAPFFSFLFYAMNKSGEIREFDWGALFLVGYFVLAGCHLIGGIFLTVKKVIMIPQLIALNSSAILFVGFAIYVILNVSC
jgi:hypothetical protein